MNKKIKYLEGISIQCPSPSTCQARWGKGVILCMYLYPNWTQWYCLLFLETRELTSTYRSSYDLACPARAPGRRWRARRQPGRQGEGYLLKCLVNTLLRHTLYFTDERHFMPTTVIDGRRLSYAITGDCRTVTSVPTYSALLINPPVNNK